MVPTASGRKAIAIRCAWSRYSTHLQDARLVRWVPRFDRSDRLTRLTRLVANLALGEVDKMFFAVPLLRLLWEVAM